MFKTSVAVYIAKISCIWAALADIQKKQKKVVNENNEYKRTSDK